VGNNQTRNGRSGFIAVCITAALAGCAGDDVDPTAARWQQEPWQDTPLPEPEMATASVSFASAAPAPMAEMAPRAAAAERRAAAIVVGHNATHAIDGEFLQGFAAATGTFDGKPGITTDRDAIELMQLGRADFAVVGGTLSPRDQQAGLRGTKLGVELFALSVSPQSPLRSLTHVQVRQVFTGQVHSWSQLGLEGGAIVAVVPSDRAMAERAARVLIPGDAFASTCLQVASERHVADQILREPGAIGIVRVTGQPRVDGQKLLSIDWSPPTVEAYGYATYPYGIATTLVTSGQPAGIAEELLRFARSAEGRATLVRTLVPLP
jgi:ABC-type phosphate transport system substrate-binding protein